VIDLLGPAFVATGALDPARTLAVFPALALGLGILFLLLVPRSTSPVAARAARVEIAIEIVRQRFARAEIDAEEYNRLVSGLTRSA
jgi:uncharacterized membrane protein